MPQIADWYAVRGDKCCVHDNFVGRVGGGFRYIFVKLLNHRRRIETNKFLKIFIVMKIVSLTDGLDTTPVSTRVYSTIEVH